MSTTKAYVAGLSTTGVLIASILVLLTLGSGFVAFDGLPGAGSPKGPVERVVVDDEALGAGKKKRSQRPSKARDPGLLGAVERYPSAPLSRAATASVGAARGRGAAERRTRGWRASQGHGGADVPAVGVIGGGASVGGAGADEGDWRGTPVGRAAARPQRCQQRPRPRRQRSQPSSRRRSLGRRPRRQRSQPSSRRRSPGRRPTPPTFGARSAARGP